MLRIKQQQYMEGFQKIKALDNSLFNKPVLGEEANQLKQKYMSDISKELKDLPNMDLSLPQNVATAQRAFEPMINDQVLNYNRELTSNAMTQSQVAESFELSDDPKKRAQYHPAAKQDIYDMMEEISEAGLDPKNYQKIAKRKFTPFFDIKQDIIDRFKSEKNMDLVYDEVQGNYIVKTTNGERALNHYEVMASDILNDPKYNAQFTVQSRVELNKKIRDVRSSIPGISKDQARQQVISEMGSSAEAYYTDLTTNLGVQANGLRQNLTAMGRIETDPNKPGYDPQRLETAVAYGRDIANLERKKNSIAGNKASLLKGIGINPEGYIAERIRDGYASSFARGRAAATSREVRVNEVPFKEDASKYNWAQHNLAVQKEINDVNNPTKSKTGMNPDGTVKMTAQQIKEEAVAPTMMGYEANNVGGPRNEYQLWNNYMTKINEKANSALLDVNSGMIGVVSTLGGDITPTDIMNLSSAMSKDMANADYKYSKEETASSNKITKAIQEKYKINVTGPSSFANALYTITKDFGSRVAKGEIQDDGGLLLKLEGASDDYARNKKEYTALNDEFENLVLKNIASNPKFKNLIYEENGRERIITPEKLAGEFKNIRYVNPETNRVEKITKDMAISMATDMLVGKDPIGTGTETQMASTSSYPVINVNGQKIKVYVSPQESKMVSTADPNSGHIYWDERALLGLTDKLKHKYGKASELKVTYESALSQVVPNLKYWQDKTGQMTPVVSMPFSSQLKGEDTVKLIGELSLGNNIASATVTDADGTVRDLTPAERMAYMNLTKGNEDEIEKAFGTPRYKPFTSGRGSVELTLSPSLTEEYIKNNNLGNLVGRPVTFNLSSDAQGQTIKKIAVDEKFFTYGDVLKGKTVESNSVLTPLGYSFTVVPNYNDERANSVTVYYNYKMPNKDNSKEPVVQKVASNPIIIKGDGAVDIDQVIAEARRVLIGQFKLTQQSVPKVAQGSSTAVDPTRFIR
jgi:hypothetical protein